MSDPKSGKSLLLALNNPGLEKHVIHCLTNNLNKFLLASSGNEVIGICELHPEISMAILSSDLPDKNGFETIENIRKMLPDIPIILLANRVSPESCRLAAMVGCNEILQLPLNEKELQAITKKYS